MFSCMCFCLKQLYLRNANQQFYKIVTKMSFFGVTSLGYQNKIREYCREPIDHSKTYLPPAPGAQPKRAASCLPIDQVSRYGPGPEGSHKEYLRFRRQHIRDPKGPIEYYRRPLTCNQTIGFFHEYDPIYKNLPWTYVKRHANVSSEMTKFVSNILLTNKTFSLF